MCLYVCVRDVDLLREGSALPASSCFLLRCARVCCVCVGGGGLVVCVCCALPLWRLTIDHRSVRCLLGVDNGQLCGALPFWLGLARGIGGEGRLSR